MGLTGRAAATVSRGRLAATLRRGVTQGGPTPFAGARDVYDDRAVLLGVVLPAGSGSSLSASAGPALTYESRVRPRSGGCGGGGVLEIFPPTNCKPYVQERSGASLALALEAAIRRRLTERYGLSVTAFGILNGSQPYGGVTVNLSFGSQP